MKLKMKERTLAPSNFILERVELGLRDAAKHDRLRKVEDVKQLLNSGALK